MSKKEIRDKVLKDVLDEMGRLENYAKGCAYDENKKRTFSSVEVDYYVLWKYIKKHLERHIKK